MLSVCLGGQVTTSPKYVCVVMSIGLHGSMSVGVHMSTSEGERTGLHVSLCSVVSFC